MIIGLGSQSEVKRAAVIYAMLQFNLNDAQLLAVKASSGVNEQPFSGETAQGARNRVTHTARLVPGANFCIAIESGLYLRGGHYQDIALVLVRLPNGEFLQQESQAVTFPTDAVEEAIRRGAATWTAGKVLQEWGRVKHDNDPHACLVGRSRAEFINDAVVSLFYRMWERGLLRSESE